MTAKIQCLEATTYDEKVKGRWTSGKTYPIYVGDNNTFYIKDDKGECISYVHDEGLNPVVELVNICNQNSCSTFMLYDTDWEKEEEPEKDIKKEVHELLDKATELIYNNQEELNISLDDFITIVKIKEDLK